MSDGHNDVIDRVLLDHWGDEPPTILNDSIVISEVRKSVNAFIAKIVEDAAKMDIELESEAVAKRASFAISKGVNWWQKEE